ncbi:hypothetical protein F5J12DRAFT_854486 [Pisolithus orientalis]|uniref:uncharacterized protein n=1 Tax=Pisolithus orientalis TaxID=936130 RepID=UPI0022242584|nr:uncharacterized protein F5J12DRAFT_854486 [Pisolithus orientalis]KAI5995994.1 hypothetical protein F5J12DRAFT_854486 [Pisolithus orientalis]
MLHYLGPFYLLLTSSMRTFTAGLNSIGVAFFYKHLDNVRQPSFLVMLSSGSSMLSSGWSLVTLVERAVLFG